MYSLRNSEIIFPSLLDKGPGQTQTILPLKCDCPWEPRECCTAEHAPPLTSCLHSSVQLWTDFKAQRGLPGGSVVKNLLAYAGDVEDMGLIPVSERSPEGRTGNPILLLENPIYRRAWQATVHWVTKSWTWLPHMHRVQRGCLELRAYLPHRHLRAGRALLISKESIFNKLYYS